MGWAKINKEPMSSIQIRYDPNKMSYIISAHVYIVFAYKWNDFVVKSIILLMFYILTTYACECTKFFIKYISFVIRISLC